MTPCPSDENLARLLADALSATERDAIAMHVERCKSCQEKLTVLSEVPGAELWRRGGQDPPLSESERQIVDRLKRMCRTAAQTPHGPADTTIGSRACAIPPLPQPANWNGP